MLLLTLGVAAAALASVALLSRLAVSRAYVSLETEERQMRLARLPDVLGEARGLSAAEIDARLAQAAANENFRLLLVSQQGRVLGASTPELRQARVTVLAADRLELEEQEQQGRFVRLRKTVLVGAPRVSVPGVSDDTIGGLTLSRPRLEFQPLLKQANIGSRVMRDLVLTFDLRNRRLRLAKPASATAPAS